MFRTEEVAVYFRNAEELRTDPARRTLQFEWPAKKMMMVEDVLEEVKAVLATEYMAQPDLYNYSLYMSTTGDPRRRQDIHVRL